MVADWSSVKGAKSEMSSVERSDVRAEFFRRYDASVKTGSNFHEIKKAIECPRWISFQAGGRQLLVVALVNGLTLKVAAAEIEANVGGFSGKGSTVGALRDRHQSSPWCLRQQLSIYANLRGKTRLFVLRATTPIQHCFNESPCLDTTPLNIDNW